MEDWLTPADKTELLTIARDAISHYLDGANFVDLPASPNLERPGAAFVTIWMGEHLRGCIGRVVAELPLAQTVALCAVDAAIADPRFAPLRRDELPHATLEISVLSPLERINSPADIEIGRHGLLIRLGAASGLLLPQVASEYNWSVTQFLQHTCEKAGLQRDAYLSPAAVIYRYEVILIEEPKIPGRPSHVRKAH